MFPASLVHYIEKLSFGTLNIIKELKQYQLEAIRGADVHQYLTSLNAGVIFLKQNMGNNIQGSFPDLWSAVNDIEEHLDHKAFGIKSLKNVFDNLNITDLQLKFTKVKDTAKTLNKQMQHQFGYWK